MRGAGSIGEQVDLVVRDGKTGELKQHLAIVNGRSVDVTDLSKTLLEELDRLLEAVRKGCQQQ